MNPTRTAEAARKILGEQQISIRSLAAELGCSASHLSRWLKGEVGMKGTLIEQVEAWVAAHTRPDTFGPIDEAIEHLDKARMECLAAKKSVDAMSDYLVKKVGTIVEMKDWLLGRVK